ncbi:hypothetical protein NW768_011272 [Fusarium equiseti]|uniref:Oxidoreductase acuF-like C2H2 type zinc-finger domain-containing protein n=1 Tax=Fusarium equiseti TaxID=61235 RepID=A0ABQ8QXW9_FUSEQ|nr:hypothetical protein NW768_011272 [Fusarium equiseti]
MTTIATGENSEEISRARIVETAKSCLDSFQKCLIDASKAEKAGPAVITKSSIVRIEDQLARFSLWAANLRVFSINRDSLDSRLREAPDVRYAINSLLETLDHHLKTSASILISITADDNLARKENSMTAFGDLLDELRNDITLLHKISNTIRRASREIQNVKASKDFIIEDDEGNDVEPFLRQLFINYIHDRFPGTGESIRSRLADSMVLRRKRILYRRERYGRTSIRLPEPVAKPVIMHPRLIANGDETHGFVKRRALEASARSHVQSVAQTATTLSPEKFKKAAVPSVISVSRTVALSGAEELSFPPAPITSLTRKYNKMKREIESRGKGPETATLQEKSSEQGSEQIERMKQKTELSEVWNSCIEAVTEVTCPYCFHVLPIRDVIDDKKWKMHVKNDLDPYVCLFEECDSPGHLYSHSVKWMKHMRDHTLRWRCKSKAHGEFIAKTRADYIHHMNACHPNKFNDVQLAVLADRGALPNGPLFTSCPLCGIDNPDASIESHVVGHMRLLALKSLPTALDDTGELEDAGYQHESGDTSHSHSRSTIKDTLEDIASLSPSATTEAENESDGWDPQISGQYSPPLEDGNMPWDRLLDGDSYDQDDPVLQPFIQRASNHEGMTGNWPPHPHASQNQPLLRMDPDCAICHAPASMDCDCEPKALDLAIKHAEERMMGSIVKEIRGWVKEHAQGHINQWGRSRDSNPHIGKGTHQNPSEDASGDKGEFEGLDIDVDLSKITEYYFGLVELTLPVDDEPSVKEPQIGKIPIAKKKSSEDQPNVEGKESSAVDISVIASMQNPRSI